MNTNQSKTIASCFWQVFSVVLILAFATTVFAQTPGLHANGKIAFASDRDGNREIYVMDADGTNQVRLTNNSGVDDHPTWSPNGTKIAFICERPSGGYAICLMNGDGANKTEITSVNSPGTISWSPQGDKITFDEYSGTGREILVVNIDGSNRRNVTTGIALGDFTPSWSPDGSRILFSRYIYPDANHFYGGTIMHTIRPDGSDLRELPNGFLTDGWNDDEAKWSPAGDKIAFVVNAWDFVEDLFIANADGTNRRFFDGCDWWNNGCTIDRASPAWSPDGSKIVFSIDDAFDSYSAICVKNIDGSGFAQLTDASGRNFNPSWQPLAPAACPNPIDCADFFVNQHYRDFLNREPDDSGLVFWTNEITSCGADPCTEAKRINVSAAFFLSIEFQQTGYLVYRTYKAAYRNLPDAPVPIRFNEFLPDTQQISHGVVVNQPGWDTVLQNNKQAFSDEFVNRARFTSAYPQSMTPSEFVDTLNANAGSPLSQTERDQLVSDLSSGAKTRAEVLRAVAENQKLADAEFNRAFVLMQYFGYLRRDPNSGPETNFDGYNFWLNKLDQFNGDFVQAEMVKAFLVSSEYRQRFGP